MSEKQPDNVVTLPTQAVPQNMDAERAVLGGVMQSPYLLTEIEVNSLTPEDFFAEKHQRLWAVLLEMDRRGTPIEPMTVIDAVEAQGIGDECGTLLYVSQLPEYVTVAESVPYFARIVRQRSTMRIYRDGAVRLLDAVSRKDAELDAVQAQAEDLSRIAADRSTAEVWAPISEVVTAVYEDIEDRAARGGDDAGLPCGALSRILRPKPTQMIVLAGRPGMGKTGLALEWGEHMAGQGVGNAFVSAEMPPKDLLMRRACKLAGVPAWRAEEGRIDSQELARIRDAAARLSELPQWFTDAPGLTVEAVRSRIYAVMRKAERLGTPLQAVFVDHIGKLRGKPGQSEYDTLSHVSQELSALALRTGLMVVALSQLNREVEKRNPPRPKLSDLRASGKIEEDARAVLMVYRPEYYDKDTPNANMGEVIVAKQNGGKTGEVWLPWEGEYGSYDIERVADPVMARWS